MTTEQLLAVAEDLLRTQPSHTSLRPNDDETLSWFGRTAALIEQWNPIHGASLQVCLDRLYNGGGPAVFGGLTKVLRLLYQARHDLQMQTMGPMSLAIPSGMVFDYFDEIRKIIETARQDVLFVDPYLDAEFVARSSVQENVFLVSET